MKPRRNLNAFSSWRFVREDACVSAIMLVIFYNVCSEKEEENDEVEDMEVENSMECKLSLNSYKMRFVKGSEDYLYRKQALKRAKEVSIPHATLRPF